MWAADVHKSGNSPSMCVCIFIANCLFHISDLLVKVGEMELKLSSSLKQVLSSSSKDHSTLMDVSSNSLLFGSSVSPRSLQMVDVESKKILFNMSASHDVPQSQLAGDLHGVKFVSEEDCLFVSCNGERGSIVVWDRREPPAKQKVINWHSFAVELHCSCVILYTLQCVISAVQCIIHAVLFAYELLLFRLYLAQVNNIQLMCQLPIALSQHKLHTKTAALILLSVTPPILYQS